MGFRANGGKDAQNPYFACGRSRSTGRGPCLRGQRNDGRRDARLETIGADIFAGRASRLQRSGLVLSQGCVLAVRSRLRVRDLRQPPAPAQASQGLRPHPLLEAAGRSCTSMSVRTGRRPIAPANCARRWHALSETLRSIHAKFTGRSPQQFSQRGPRINVNGRSELAMGGLLLVRRVRREGDSLPFSDLGIERGSPSHAGCLLGG